MFFDNAHNLLILSTIYSAECNLFAGSVRTCLPTILLLNQETGHVYSPCRIRSHPKSMAHLFVEIQSCRAQCYSSQSTSIFLREYFVLCGKDGKTWLTEENFFCRVPIWRYKNTFFNISSKGNSQIIDCKLTKLMCKPKFHIETSIKFHIEDYNDSESSVKNLFWYTHHQYISVAYSKKSK